MCRTSRKLRKYRKRQPPYPHIFSRLKLVSLKNRLRNALIVHFPGPKHLRDDSYMILTEFRIPSQLRQHLYTAHFVKHRNYLSAESIRASCITNFNAHIGQYLAELFLIHGQNTFFAFYELCTTIVYIFLVVITVLPNN